MDTESQGRASAPTTRARVVAGRATLERETGSDPSAGFGLPTDLIRQSRRRVAVVAWLVVLGSGADMVLIGLDLAFGTGRQRGVLAMPGVLPLLGNVANVIVATIVIVAARSPHVSHRTLLSMALVFEVLLCASVSVSNPLAIYLYSNALPVLTWCTPLIVMFPLLVPCPPRRTLVTALVAASTAPLGLLVLEALGIAHVSRDALLSISFSPFVAVVIAYVGSNVLYGLGREVAEARRMGSYQLERLLGQGGMGEVWLATHRLLARPAAVKLVRPDLVATSAGGADAIMQRFEREAQATAAMRSPHTVNLYDFGIAPDGAFYYVMELLEGLTADALVKRFGPVPAERAIHLVRQICHSLAEAHAAGLVHRDIKPANIFVCKYGRDVDFVKVLDFGLVKTLTVGDGRADLTAANVIFGTPAYMAPEQALGQSPDSRSDIYAVGCVAYWMLTGHTVFDGDTPLALAMHHATTAPTPPSARTELAVSESLDRAILSCLQKDPALRPQSADALADLLTQCAPTPGWTHRNAQQWWAEHQPAAVASSRE